MAWRKIGRIFLPTGELEWMRTHASMPIARTEANNNVKIYFSTRDSQQRSHLASLDVNMRNPLSVLAISEHALLSPGRLGTFDDSGAMLSWITEHGDSQWFYYIGWNLGVSVPFRNAVGIAVATNGVITRLGEGPVLDRTFTEPHFVASCCVLPSETGWTMWYLSCVGWELYNGRPRHRYNIKYATSADGVAWRRDGRVCIDFAHPGEYAISRPTVIRDPDCFRMWYSFRGDTYRIGYAESADGIAWTRMDHEAGIACSSSCWDSKMIEYPFVFDHGSNRYMLYNGNGYGQTGFGIAVWE